MVNIFDPCQPLQTTQSDMGRYFLQVSLPNDKIFDWSKLKAFPDEKINMTEKLKYVLGRLENTVGKGENAGNQHFLFFLQCFQKASYTGPLKVVIVW